MAVGLHRSLAIREHGQVTWWEVTRSPDDLARAILGERLDQAGNLLDVDAVSKESDYRPPGLLGATMAGRQLESRVSQALGPPDLGLLRALAKEWSLTPSIPPHQTLPDDLGEAFVLNDPVKGDDERSTVTIARRVSETWMTAAGPREVRYEVIPGQTTVELTAEDTGQRSTTLEFDRSGHLVAQLSTCSYCRGRTCARCDDRVVACTVCTIPVCRRCAHPRHLDLAVCGACGTLSPLKRRERRQLDLDLPRKAEVWASTDPVHAIRCIRQDGAWRVESGTMNGGAWLFTRVAGSRGQAATLDQLCRE